MPNEDGLAFWQALFDQQHATLEATTESRTRIAWRLCRNLAVLQGKLGPDRPFEEAEREDLLTASPLVAEVRKSFPFSMREALVPVLPASGCNMVSWQHAMLTLAEVLGCEELRRSDPIVHSQPYFWGLLDLNQLHNTFPTPAQIAQYERAVLKKASKLHLEYGSFRASEKLQNGLKLTQNEVRMVFSMLRYNVKSVILDGNDPEEEKAMMILHVQDVRRRAKQSLNLREEMNALKLETVIRGLNRNSDDSDISSIFGKVVDTIASKPSIPLVLPMPQNPAQFAEVEPLEERQEEAG